MDPRESILAATEAAARAYARKARSPATERAYERDARDFQFWCAALGLTGLPATPHTLALYLTAKSQTLKTSTLARRLAAIVAWQRSHGHALDTKDPDLALVWRGIRRECGVATSGKAALMLEDLAALVAMVPEGLKGVRDRAILLLTYGAALRRSETVALDVTDLSFSADGLSLRLARGKTDQEGRGQWKAVAHGRDGLCAVTAVRNWVMAAGLSAGPLFRAIDRCGRMASERLSDKAVALILKQALARLADARGMSAATMAAWLARYSAHSLRAGLVTAATAAGASEGDILRHTGHRSLDSMRRYVRPSSAFRGNVAGRVLGQGVCGQTAGGENTTEAGGDTEE